MKIANSKKLEGATKMEVGGDKKSLVIFTWPYL